MKTHWYLKADKMYVDEDGQLMQKYKVHPLWVIWMLIRGNFMYEIKADEN